VVKDNSFSSAEMFYLDFENNFEKGKSLKRHFNQASFMLNQATEHLYACLILVYTNTRPTTWRSLTVRTTNLIVVLKLFSRAQRKGRSAVSTAEEGLY
jgi:hypothetical protein